MSLSRAFTTRRNNKETSPPMPSRSLTTKHAFPAGTIRNKISAPVELISTTNMLSYNAPDIYPKKSTNKALSTSSASSTSGDDSDRSPTTTSSPISSPDGSLIGSMPSSPEPNHLTCYFGSPNSRQSTQSTKSDDAPVIPQRALSHTKKTAEILARKRSDSRMSASKNSISTLRSVRSSINMFSPSASEIPAPAPVPAPHPFGQELAQVSELAEEYGISQEQLVVADPEEMELVSKGFFKYCADDYIKEIECFYHSAFENEPRTALWI